MLTSTPIPSLAEADARPLAQRLYAVQHHLAMILGYQWVSPGAVAAQRDHIAQAIAQLQAAQAELDPPATGTD